jgi:hypothetical protein
MVCRHQHNAGIFRSIGQSIGRRSIDLPDLLMPGLSVEDQSHKLISNRERAYCDSAILDFKMSFGLIHNFNLERSSRAVSALFLLILSSEF